MPGRPVMLSFLEEQVQNAALMGCQPQDVCVLVCGPAAMLSETMEACGRLGLHSHAETFDY